MSQPEPARGDRRGPASPAEPSPAAVRAVRRALATRESASFEEVQRLLDAALDVMQTAGERSGPRVADVVRMAGLSNQAFYRHFASKDELVAAVVEAGAWRLASYLEYQLARQETPEDQIRAWVLGVLTQAAKPTVATATRAVLWNMRQLPASMGRQLRPDAIDGLLRDPLRAAGSTDPERDAATISAAVFGRLDHFLWEAEPTGDDLDHAVAFCLAAVRR